jgi:hypothetical protein
MRAIATTYITSHSRFKQEMNMPKTMADQRDPKAQKPATVREAFF